MERERSKERENDKEEERKIDRNREKERETEKERERERKRDRERERERKVVGLVHGLEFFWNYIETKSCLIRRRRYQQNILANSYQVNIGLKRDYDSK